MAKKKSVGKIVTVQIIRSFLVVAAMLATGLASYKITMEYYQVTAEQDEDKNMLDIVSDVVADSVSRNLIYSVDNNTHRIMGMVIEVLNTNTGNLDYITVPAGIQVSIGSTLYQRIADSGISVPQIFNVADINRFFKEGPSYEYGMLLLEDYLGIDIGYYTCMDQSVFSECFEQSADSMTYVLKESIMLTAANAVAENDMDGFIKSWNDRMTSDLRIKNRLKYSSYYANVKKDYIYYHIFPGTYNGTIFSPNPEECADMYKTIILDTEHTSKQGEIPDISSAGLNIKVLNGSGGTNIATATREVFARDGLNVVKIADNPDGIINDTIIYVTTEGMGRDLLKYFKSASIKVQGLEEGIDIMVVVGASDADIGES